MDLTPIISLASVLVGSLATFGGVWLTTRSNRKAEDKRLALEAEREATRIRREDGATARDAIEAKARKQIETYEQISQGFIGELSALRGQRTNDPEARYSKFAALFDPQWTVNGDTRLRRVVASLIDDAHRLRITQILDAIVDHEAIGLMEFMEASEQIEIFMLLGFDLTTAYARGQEPDGAFEARWTAFRKQVAESDAYKESQRQKAIEKAQADAKARAEAKAAEDARLRAEQADVWASTEEPWKTSADEAPF